MSLARVRGNPVYFPGLFNWLACLLDASAKRLVWLPSVQILVPLISIEISSKPFYLAVWLVIGTFGNQLTTLPSN